VFLCSVSYITTCFSDRNVKKQISQRETYLNCRKSRSCQSTCHI